jgi:glucokinase
MSGSLCLGIEIGGTKLQLGLGRGDGTILALRRLAVDPALGASGIRDQIAGVIDPLLGETGAIRKDLTAAGIGFGGPVDTARGVVTTSNQIDGWAGFPLADWTRQVLGISDVVLHNDADTAALAEARFGAGLGVSPVLYVTIGSGIGGGLVIDGHIYRGAGAGAVEIGHLWVMNEAGVGSMGSLQPSFEKLERIASGWSIERAALLAVESLDRDANDAGPLSTAWEHGSRRITASLVAEAARAGDPLAIKVLERAARAFAHGLAAAVTLLAPRRIVLGGGVSLIGEDLWFAPIRRELHALVFEPFRGQYDVVPAALGEGVVVQGALALARDVSGRSVDDLGAGSLSPSRRVPPA